MYSFSSIYSFSPDIQKLLSEKMCGIHYLEDELKNVNMNYVLCYTDNFDIIGVVAISHSPYFNFGLTPELLDMEKLFTGSVSYIDSLWVDEKYRNKGIAKSLLQQAYLLWLGSDNVYLNSSIRCTSGLYLSGYYDSFPKLGSFVSTKNGREYVVYYLEKLQKLIK